VLHPNPAVGVRLQFAVYVGEGVVQSSQGLGCIVLPRVGGVGWWVVVTCNAYAYLLGLQVYVSSFETGWWEEMSLLFSM
jgi:hypothetical protein